MMQHRWKLVSLFGVFALGLAISLISLSGCRDRPLPPLQTIPVNIEPHTPRQGTVVGPTLSSVRSEPNLRVRIARNTDKIRLTSSAGSIIAQPPVSRQQAASPQRFASPLTLTAEGNAFRIVDGQGRSGRWPVESLSLYASAGQTLSYDNRTYPGKLQIVLKNNENRPRENQPSQLDLINIVPLETYLPGVLEKELFGHWHLETFKAQAIAARSYALFERSQASHRHYDLESTTASQVYGGQAKNSRAIQAVAQTRGIVLAFDERIVPAFYSSTTGGHGQDAAVAFPNMADIVPLRGQSRAQWGSISTSWRWGPISRDVQTLSKRIVAWGKQRSHPVTRLGTLASVDVATVSRTGRPASFRLTNTAGQTFTLRCEAFRFACNTNAPGLPDITPETRLKSSDLTIHRTGNTFRFTGRGFGHGVGLGQWGAQHLAQTGYAHDAILSYYYPGSMLRRLY